MTRRVDILWRIFEKIVKKLKVTGLKTSFLVNLSEIVQKLFCNFVVILICSVNLTVIFIYKFFFGSGQGRISNLKFIFLPPPLLDLYFFPQLKFIIMRGCAPQKKLSAFFCCNFVYF